MAAARSLGASDAEVSGMETEEEFEFQHWAEKFIRDNPPPPLTDKQRDMLDVLGRHMPSLADL